MNSTEPNQTSRRQFIKTSTAATVGGIITAPAILGTKSSAASPGDPIRVGLVGCGGRGTGAAAQALKAGDDIHLVAVGDAFEKAIAGSLKAVSKEAGEDKVKVKADKMFVGLDAYQKVIDSGVDVVLLASPPGFRPVHLRAAVEAGKQIFCEKPMATDAPGVRSVMESVRIAKEKKLALVAGFCWRYDYQKRELFKRIHDGQIGQVRAMYGTYLTGPVKPMPPAESRPAGITDLEWMVRNWYNFNWLGGDGLVEQAVHTIDWLAWAMKDVPPSSCTAVGGRQIPAHGGNIYDHIEVNFEWEDGTHAFLAQRQIPGCHNENFLTVIGSKGTGLINSRGVSIIGEDPWRYQGEKPDMYQVEHNELFASIRADKPINNGDRMAKSTLMAIMGRTAAYTGQQITWDMALGSQQVLVPEIKDWNSVVDVQPMAMPGRTKFV
jgi:predicted dehydrogenase